MRGSFVMESRTAKKQMKVFWYGILIVFMWQFLPEVCYLIRISISSYQTLFIVRIPFHFVPSYSLLVLKEPDRSIFGYGLLLVFLPVIPNSGISFRG